MTEIRKRNKKRWVSLRRKRLLLLRRWRVAKPEAVAANE
jgi:hypothetical protein